MFNTLNNFEDPIIRNFLLHRNKSISLSGLNYPLKLLLIQSILNTEKNVLFILPNEQASLKYQNDLKSLFGLESDIFPYQEVSFYEDITINRYIYQEQVNILNKNPKVVLAPVRSLLEKFPTQNFYNKNSITIKRNDEIDLDELIKKLVQLGYKKVNVAMDIGEFSTRGDILDIYSLSPNPVRIEFFGDSIEDIRLFEPNTQKSFKKAEEIKIFPLYKFILDKNTANFEKINFENKELHSEIKEKLEEEGYFEGIEFYGQYFNPDLISVLSHFSNYILVFDEMLQINAKYDGMNKDLIEEFEKINKTDMKLPLKNFNHTTFEEFKKEIELFKIIRFDNFINEDIQSLDFNTSLPPIFTADMTKIADYINEKSKEDYKVFICTNYQKRIEEILREYEIFSDNIKILPPLALGGGILEDEKYIFLTDKELYNKHAKDVTVRKYTQNKASAEYIDSINDISEGEYVVHSIHGVGIYRGLSKQELDSNLKDYLEIEFANSDKLFMPAEQVNLLCRYRGGGVDARPKLSKMGGASWDSAKHKAKAEVEEIAKDLLILYAKREMAEGIAFDPDTNWQFEMEEAFEFSETPDQMQAIIDTKGDMESRKPMDRLICADVGFGKTEVAMRAIFKAVMSGKQAAMIAPTTVLALQHFKTIEERFKPFSINVELLSRFKTKKEQKETLERLKNGECDVVIGTHRLLQNDIEFKNLGFLVIDEEHRFGVKHKERLKNMRKNIDILSLSATPIPRTLNMALSGLKDMSVINTPPKNRLSVKTYVGEFNEKHLINAINNEISRDGQVFYLYNRVETIYDFQAKLQKLVPNAKIAVAHGQMREGELEKIMCQFADREYDILICTTIIESGLDLPNANTIIIHDSDRFGLAQLYQLRGRVGRSDRQAYCYCFYKQSKVLTPDAFKRLNAIKDFATLGSGYHIALKDMEIRGVGNILGSKQHGHMVNVGFDTYCNLLEECIQELKNKKPAKKKVITTIDLKVSAFIPDNWVGSTEAKIIEYKKLSDVKNLSELENMEISLKDRFSKLPQSVDNLIKIIRLRILANEAGITLIRETSDYIRIYTPFTHGEWEIIRGKIKEWEIKSAFIFKEAPKNLDDTKGILLMNKNNKDFSKIFNILEFLFYHINKTIVEFNLKNKE